MWNLPSSAPSDRFRIRIALDAIVAAMKEREIRRTRLLTELTKLESRANVAAIDTARLNLALRERLTD